MDRRTAVRTLATATILPVLAPADAAALIRARRVLETAAADPPEASGYLPAALSPREMEIVGLVSDIILPPTDTPGATDVGVPAFVDLIVSEWMDEASAREIHDGLADLDAVASDRFGRTFAACTDGERASLVAELDASLPEPGSDDEVPDGFYPTLKRLVVTGYFTTETGAALTGYRITPGAFEGCAVPGAPR